jgi:1,4-dihydroxy-2-naphthoyl-CoA hydrolase
MIWQRKPTMEELSHFGKGNMLEYLGIEFLEVGEDYITAQMPVDQRTRQPYGILHGGASVVLAETLGSMGAQFCVDETHYCVGLDINANHIRAKKEGVVIGTAKPLHLGHTTQVWEIMIRDEKNHLTCISRLTMAVLAKKS